MRLMHKQYNLISTKTLHNLCSPLNYLELSIKDISIASFNDVILNLVFHKRLDMSPILLISDLSIIKVSSLLTSTFSTFLSWSFVASLSDVMILGR